jgi:hypothetical protein
MEVVGFQLFSKVQFEGVAAEAEAHGFEGDHFLWVDIAQIGVGADQFEKVKLLIFLGCFPEDLCCGDLCEDLLDKSFAHFAGVAVEADRSRFAGLGDDIGGAGVQFGLHQLNPLIRWGNVFSVFIF